MCCAAWLSAAPLTALPSLVRQAAAVLPSLKGLPCSACGPRVWWGQALTREGCGLQRAATPPPDCITFIVLSLCSLPPSLPACLPASLPLCLPACLPGPWNSLGPNDSSAWLVTQIKDTRGEEAHRSRAASPTLRSLRLHNGRGRVKGRLRRRGVGEFFRRVGVCHPRNLPPAVPVSKDNFPTCVLEAVSPIAAQFLRIWRFALLMLAFLRQSLLQSC